MVPESATRHYQGDAGRRYHEEKRAIPEIAAAWIARLRAQKLTPYVGKDDAVFEYGVGSGWNMGALRCGKRIGFDVAEFLAPRVRAQGIEFISDSLKLSAESMDVALCHHTLEHVLHPPDVLRELHRVLRYKGKLLLFVPFERERRYRLFDRVEPNHHLYSWNAQTLGNLVEECGFEVTQAGIGRFGYSRFAAAWAVRLHLGEPGFRALRALGHLLKPAFEIRLVAVKK